MIDEMYKVAEAMALLLAQTKFRFFLLGVWLGATIAAFAITLCAILVWIVQHVR